MPETSGCQLSVGDLILFAAALPDDELVSSFRESDRRQSGDARESCIYQCPVKQLCDRLDVMGFTLADAERSMREFVRNQVSLELRYFVGLREPTSEGPRKTSQNVGIDLLNRSTFEQWREAYVRLTNEWCRGASVGSSEHNPLDKHLYDFRHEERDAPIVGIRSPFGSIRSGLRVSLSAFEATAEARLDCSRLVAEEWIDADGVEKIQNFRSNETRNTFEVFVTPTVRFIFFVVVSFAGFTPTTCTFMIERFHLNRNFQRLLDSHDASTDEICTIEVFEDEDEQSFRRNGIIHSSSERQ